LNWQSCSFVKGTDIRFMVVFAAKRYHAFRPVMVLDVPRWVKVMPVKVRAAASWHRATESNLASKLSNDS